MKNLKIIVLLLFVVHSAAYAQEKYSLENLQKASQEELDIYLSDATKLQKSGKTVTIVGAAIIGATAVTVGTIAIIDPGDWAMAAASIAILGGIAGLGTMAVGIPMNITGKKRVERINSISKSAYNITMDVRPCFQYNLAAQNLQPGVTLRIRF